MSIPDGAPTYQAIRYDSSSSSWGLAYHCIMQNGLHDRTNKGASFVIEPLSIAGVSCTRQWPLSLYSYIIIVWFRQYPKNTSHLYECEYA